MTSATTLHYVAQPMGGPSGVICQQDPESGNIIEGSCQDIVINDETTVVGVDPGPPPGTRPGEGDPGPGPAPTPTPAPAPTPAPSDTYVSSWDEVITTTDRCAENFDKNDRLGINHGGVNDTPGRENHSGVDIQGNDGDPVYAWRGGRVSLVYNEYCGHGVNVHHDDGSSTRYCHFDTPSSFPGHDNRIRAGALVGHVGRLGRGVTGFHVHITHTQADDTKIEYFSALPDSGQPTAEQLNENGC